jgi:ribosomal protein L40E
MENGDVVSRREFLDTTGKAVVAIPCCMLCGEALAGDAAKEAGKPEFKLVAPCGIYCGACEALVDSMYAKDPKDVKCCGCLSSKVVNWTETQCKVRRCAMEKKIESCALCKSYPDCPKLKEVLNWSKTGDNLKMIADKGLDEFKKEQKAKWSCKKCGAAFSNKDKKCRKCGEAVAVAK